MIRLFETEVFNGTIATGDPATSVGPFNSGTGEVFAVFVQYAPGMPGNTLTVGVEWQGLLAPSMPPSTFPSETITASKVLKLCPPGPTKKMTLLLLSTGTGDDAVTVWVAAKGSA